MFKSFLECKNGYFGLECRSKCGHCLESKHCHHINGSCLNGCLHGYRGDLCNESLYFLLGLLALVIKM